MMFDVDFSLILGAKLESAIEKLLCFLDLNQGSFQGLEFQGSILKLGLMGFNSVLVLLWD
jgi:hypothetical protein